MSLELLNNRRLLQHTPCKILGSNWFQFCCCWLLILLSYHNNARENEGSACKNTQTSTLHDLTKLKDQCLLQLPFHGYKEKHKHPRTSGDQTWICLKSSSTQTSPHTCARKHKHARTYTHTHTNHCSVLFLWKQVAVREKRVCVFECVFLYQRICSYSIYPHTLMLLSVCYSPASNLIRSTAGLWLCHIYIQMEI